MQVIFLVQIILFVLLIMCETIKGNESHVEHFPFLAFNTTFGGNLKMLNFDADPL